MIRAILVCLTFCFSILSLNASADAIESGIKGSSDSIFSQIEAAKDRKNNELSKKVKESLKPLILLKNKIEAHLPQKELRAIKQIAFRLMLIARRYL